MNELRGPAQPYTRARVSTPLPICGSSCNSRIATWNLSRRRECRTHVGLSGHGGFSPCVVPFPPNLSWVGYQTQKISPICRKIATILDPTPTLPSFVVRVEKFSNPCPIVFPPLHSSTASSRDKPYALDPRPLLSHPRPSGVMCSIHDSKLTILLDRRDWKLEGAWMLSKFLVPMVCPGDHFYFH